jgi:hypothetical protein
VRKWQVRELEHKNKVEATKQEIRERFHLEIYFLWVCLLTCLSLVVALLTMAVLLIILFSSLLLHLPL